MTRVVWPVGPHAGARRHDARGRRAARRRGLGEAGRSRVRGDAEGHDEGEARHGREQLRARPGAGRLGRRRRGGPHPAARWPSATEVEQRAPGGDGGLDRAQQQGEERDQRAQHEHRHGDAHGARRGEQADEQPQVDDGDPPQRTTVEPRRGRAHHGRAPTEHRGDQVGQRAEEQLRGEADHDHRGDGPVAVGQRGPRRAGRQSPSDEEEGDDPPPEGGGDRPGREDLRRGLSRGPDQGAPPPGQPGGVPDQPGQGRGARAQGRPGREHRDRGDQHRKGLPGKAFGAVVHPGAQHRRPQGDQRAGDGEPDPAEHHHHRVRDEHLPVPLVVQAARQPGAEGRADRDARRRGEVVANGDPEPPRQRTPQPAPQLDAVPQHRARHRRRARHGERPDAGGHPDQHRGDPRDEQRDAAVLLGAVVDLGGGLQQGLGEVGAPHHRGVGERAEQHQVHEEPARPGYPAVHEGERGGEAEPDQARAVTQRPGAAGCRRGGRVHGWLLVEAVRTARAGGWRWAGVPGAPVPGGWR